MQGQLKRVANAITRQAFAVGIYRMLISFLLLVVGFSSFRGYEVFVALAIIAFNQGINACIVVQEAHFKLNSAVLDNAERKTRHTIVLAAERAGQDFIEGPGFWTEVHNRLEAEQPSEPVPDTPWKGLGAILGKLALYVAGDLVSVTLASIIVG